MNIVFADTSFRRQYAGISSYANVTGFFFSTKKKKIILFSSNWVIVFISQTIKCENYTNIIFYSSCCELKKKKNNGAHFLPWTRLSPWQGSCLRMRDSTVFLLIYTRVGWSFSFQQTRRPFVLTLKPFIKVQDNGEMSIQTHLKLSPGFLAQSNLIPKCLLPLLTAV